MFLGRTPIDASGEVMGADLLKTQHRSSIRTGVIPTASTVARRTASPARACHRLVYPAPCKASR
jgi:hypothetical protein